MIETLEIHNFKSVKDLTLPCKRFNIFIGEPNTGKSNILEALGLISFVGVRRYALDTELAGFVRHERMSNLFYEEDIGCPLSVGCDDLMLDLSYRNGQYQGECFSNPSDPDHEVMDEISGDTLTITKTVSYLNIGLAITEPTVIKFYRFPTGKDFEPLPSEYLLPPLGLNLPSLLIQNRELRNMVNLPFTHRGLRLGLRPQENKIELVKSFDDIIISYPYSLVSDTWQRLTFYTAAIMTNQDSVLVFEEPETHSFPNETKLLAEQIALDENNNQYFIVTHNPYFLMPLLSKAPKDEIAINIVYQNASDYQTRVRPLEPEELPELFELNIFANLERYLEDD